MDGSDCQDDNKVEKKWCWDGWVCLIVKMTIIMIIIMDGWDCQDENESEILKPTGDLWGQECELASVQSAGSLDSVKKFFCRFNWFFSCFGVN